VDGQQDRPTEYQGDKIQPPDWWQQFWKRYYQKTGCTRADVIKTLRQRHGANWTPLTERDLANEAERQPNSDAGSVTVPNFRTPTLMGFGIAGCAAGAYMLRRRRQQTMKNV
jgi:hypothetical protein